MSVLATTMEIGVHPASALLIGGLAAAFLRGRFASIALISDEKSRSELVEDF